MAPVEAPVRPATAVASAKPKDDFEREFGEGATDETPSGRTAGAKPKDSDLPERLEESDIMSTVLRHKAEIDQCKSQYQRTDPDSSERLVMRWTVHLDGRTSNVTVQTEEFAGTPVAACLQKVIKKITFPKHQIQHDPVSFPFVL